MAIGQISSVTTWVLGTVAPATWFQGVQDNLNAWMGGAGLTGATFKALQIDGTGGLTSTVPAGLLNVGGANQAASYARGQFGKEFAPVAMGTASLSNPTCSGSGYNVASASRQGTGTYQITLTSVVPFSGNQPAFVFSMDAGGKGYVSINAAVTSASALQIYFLNSSAALVDPTSTTSVFYMAYSLV